VVFDLAGCISSCTVVEKVVWQALHAKMKIHPEFGLLLGVEEDETGETSADS